MPRIVEDVLFEAKVFLFENAVGTVLYGCVAFFIAPGEKCVDF